GAVVYQSVEIPHRGKVMRVFVIGAEAGRPGGEFEMTRGRPILKSRYEMLADPRTGLDLGEQVRIGRHDFVVVGLLKELSSSGGDPVVVMTLRDAQIVQSQFDPPAVHRDAARQTSAVGATDLVNAVVVRLTPSSAADNVIASIRRWKHLSAISGPEQEAILTRSVIERARKQIGMFTAILLAVTTVVIGLIIYTMTMDKKKAIATLKLIGAPDSVIIKLVLEQALALGGIGFVLGAALIRLAKDYFPRRLVFEASDTAVLFGIVVAVALLASVIGIRTALKIDPASALSG
ncbi:MAG: ABC transporter permease, partial [Hyphomicrobiales bacterium]|nr:ABC transporter permease [Hyphomicrobiales bacterium]